MEKPAARNRPAVKLSQLAILGRLDTGSPEAQAPAASLPQHQQPASQQLPPPPPPPTEPPTQPQRRSQNRFSYMATPVEHRRRGQPESPLNSDAAVPAGGFSPPEYNLPPPKQRHPSEYLSHDVDYADGGQSAAQQQQPITSFHAAAHDQLEWSVVHDASEKEAKKGRDEEEAYVPHSPVRNSTFRTQGNGGKIDGGGPMSPAPFSPDVFELPGSGPPNPAHTQHHPGQITHPNMQLDADKTWKNSLWDCTGGEASTCAWGFCVPCVLYGRTAYRLKRKSEKKDPTVLLGWEKVNSSCGLMTAACGLWCLFPAIHRTRIRHQYKIDGSVPNDFLNACCCCCCTLVQNEREIADREGYSRRYAGPAGGEAYTPPTQMVYAPPPRQ